MAAALGANGRSYYTQHYSWPVIERKYLDMFVRLTTSPPGHVMEALPGLLERRRRDKRPAADVIASLPSGPVRGDASPERDER